MLVKRLLYFLLVKTKYSLSNQFIRKQEKNSPAKLARAIKLVDTEEKGKMTQTTF
jgi:hypothetical protein